MSSAASRCNVVARTEASLRKRLKFTVQFSKLDENGLLVCTIYFRTEEAHSTLLPEKKHVVCGLRREVVVLKIAC